MIHSKHLKFRAATLGAIALSAQMILSRVILGIFYGNELFLGLTLGLWLIGSGAGAITGNYLRSRNGDGFYRSFHLALCFSIVWTIAAIVAGKFIRSILHVPFAEFIITRDFIVFAIPAIMPTAFAIGLGFTLLSRLFAQIAPRGRNPATVIYILEAAGSAIAGLVITWLFTQMISHWCILFFLLTATIWLWMASLNLKHLWRWPVLAMGGLSLLLSQMADRRLTAQYWRSMSPELIYRQGCTSRYGELAVVDWAGEKQLFHNSISCTALPDTLSAQRLAALTVCQQAAPQKILLISGGLGGLAPELARYPLQWIDYVEIDRTAYNLAMSQYPTTARSDWQKPNLHTRFTDGRRFLSASHATYDLILLHAGTPSSAWDNRYYTEEFFALVRGRLSAQGIFAICDFPSGENFLGPELLELNAAIYNGLKKSFKQVAVLPGDRAIFLAAVSPGGLSLDPAVLARRFSVLRPAPSGFHPALFAQYLPVERLARIEQLLSSTSDVRRNLDAHPIAYYIDLTLWHKMTGGAAKLFRTIAGIPFNHFLAGWLVVLGLCSLLIARSRSQRPGFLWTSAIFGQSGMVMNILFIFNLQNIFGFLYEGISVAAASYMAGMGLAAWLGERLKPVKLRKNLLRLMLVNIAAPIGLTPLFSLLQLHKAGWLFFPGMAAAGALTGFAFPLLSRLHDAAQGRAQRGSIYAADLAGGTLGSFLFSAFIIPLYGFTASGILLSTACLMPLITVGLKRTKPDC